jgi:hypothetical protein
MLQPALGAHAHSKHLLRVTRSIHTPQDLTYYGFLSGAFYVASNALFFLSLDLLGEVAVPTGVTCGVTMVVSFAFGAETEGISGSMYIAVAAIVIMCFAVWGITRMQAQAARRAPAHARGCLRGAHRPCVLSRAALSP